MDAVIVWSDTEKKEYRSKRMKYIKESRFIPIGHEERTLNELLVMITAISINCREFVKRIAIVCEETDSRIEDFISGNGKDKFLPIKFIDHKELFRGFEGYLPCYSPTAIRSMLYRCRDLSDEFIVFDLSCIPMNIMKLEKLSGSGNRKSRRQIRRKKKLSIKVFPPVLTGKKEMESIISNSPGMLSRNLKYRFDSEFQSEIILSSIGNTNNTERICVIMPGEEEEDFISTLEQAENCDIIALPALSQFSKEQSRSLMDWFCARLKIRLMT